MRTMMTTMTMMTMMLVKSSDYKCTAGPHVMEILK